MIFIREKNKFKSQCHKVFITDMATNGNERKSLFYSIKTDYRHNTCVTYLTVIQVKVSLVMMFL